MKATIFYQFVIAILIHIVVSTAPAQDFKGGIIKYQQTTKYDFEKIFSVFGDNPRVKNWISSLPTESRKVQVLYLTEEKTLFEEDASANEAMSRELQGALARAEYVRPPQTDLKKVYYDFGKNEFIRQIEFMTRNFLITSSIEKQAWKLTGKQLKIQDYVCTAAEMNRGEDQVTAWFTSEIPVSIGPADFSGLPGLILAVEINGETVFMATSVDLTHPEDSAMPKPETGKEVTQEEFDKTVAEKIKEWEETRGGVRRGIR